MNDLSNLLSINQQIFYLSLFLINLCLVNVTFINCFSIFMGDVRQRKQPLEKFNQMNFRQGCMCFICARYIENREKITCLHVSEHMSDPHDSVWSPQRIFKLHLPVRKKTSHKLCVIYLITFKSFYFFLTWIQVIKERIHMYSLTDVPDQYIDSFLCNCCVL